jgi:hypothetical protein
MDISVPRICERTWMSYILFNQCKIVVNSE